VPVATMLMATDPNDGVRPQRLPAG
jgi:hypothetical protein